MGDFSKITAIILAGGKGTRMQSSLPKVLHKIAEKPLIIHTLEKLSKLQIEEIIVVVGHKRDEIKKVVGSSLKYAHQVKQLGTGHAVIQALPFLPSETNTVLVLNGDDSAFYKHDTLSEIIQKHLESHSKMTILTTIKEGTDVSGRVIRNHFGKIEGIKANSMFSEKELEKNNELVCGLYLFERTWLEEKLPKVEISPKGEYNITGLIEVAIRESVLQDLRLDDPGEWQSINTQRELQTAKLLWKQIKG